MAAGEKEEGSCCFDRKEGQAIRLVDCRCYSPEQILAIRAQTDRNSSCEWCSTVASSQCRFSPAHIREGRSRSIRSNGTLKGGVIFIELNRKRGFWRLLFCGENWKHTFLIGVHLGKLVVSGALAKLFIFMIYRVLSKKRWKHAPLVRFRLEKATGLWIAWNLCGNPVPLFCPSFVLVNLLNSIHHH